MGAEAHLSGSQCVLIRVFRKAHRRFTMNADQTAQEGRKDIVIGRIYRRERHSQLTNRHLAARGMARMETPACTWRTERHHLSKTTLRSLESKSARCQSKQHFNTAINHPIGAGTTPHPPSHDGDNLRIAAAGSTGLEPICVERSKSVLLEQAASASAAAPAVRIARISSALPRGGDRRACRPASRSPP